MQERNQDQVNLIGRIVGSVMDALTPVQTSPEVKVEQMPVETEEAQPVEVQTTSTEQPRKDNGQFASQEEFSAAIDAAIAEALSARMPQTPATVAGRPPGVVASYQAERVREYDNYEDMPDDITFEEIEKLVQNGWMPDIQKVPDIGRVSKSTLSTYRTFTGVGG